VVTLELLDGLVEVNDAVEQGEDFGGEGCHVAHGEVVKVEDGEEVVHPCCVDESPGHKREKRYLSTLSTEKHEEGVTHTLKLVEQREYMFSARMEKGPVTPSIVKGWMENLFVVYV
jgi:hypothetical protein